MTITGKMNWQLILGIILLLIAAYLIISGIGKTDFDKTGLWITRGLVILTSIGIMYFTIRNSQSIKDKIDVLQEKVKPENSIEAELNFKLGQYVSLFKNEKFTTGRIFELNNFLMSNEFSEIHYSKLYELLKLIRNDNHDSRIANVFFRDFPNKTLEDTELFGLVIGNSNTLENMLYLNVSDKDYMLQCFIKLIDLINDSGGFINQKRFENFNFNGILSNINQDKLTIKLIYEKIKSVEEKIHLYKQVRYNNNIWKELIEDEYANDNKILSQLK